MINLACLTAAPTLVRLAGSPRLAHPLTLGGLATVLRAAADAIGRDWDAGEEILFGEDAVQAWLDGEGRALVLYLALAPGWPGLDPGLAERLASADPAGAAAVVRAAFRRDATPQEGGGEMVDVASLGWSPLLFGRYLDGHLPDAVARLTLDQLHMIVSRGNKPARTGAGDGSGGGITADDAQRMWEHARARAGGPPAPEGSGAEAARTTLADLGLEIAPGQDTAGFDKLDEVTG